MNKLNPKIIVMIVIVIMVVILFGSSMYMVDKEEQAVITQFGK